MTALAEIETLEGDDVELLPDEDDAPGEPPAPPVELVLTSPPITTKQRRSARIVALAAEATGPISDSARRKLFEEWERATKTLAAAEQMRKDAIVYQRNCVETIVRKLGPGPFRHKDRLFSVSSKGSKGSTVDTVFLRELKSGGD